MSNAEIKAELNLDNYLEREYGSQIERKTLLWEAENILFTKLLNS